MTAKQHRNGRPATASALTRGGRHALALVAVAGLALAGAGCGGSTSGIAKVQWYTNPDNGGQREIAKRCTKAANGRYQIRTQPLPRSASDQREQLLRRLAAEDSSVDLISLDPVFVAEFAEAGFLAPIPRGEAKKFSAGVVRPAVEGASWHGRLATVPFWANTQVLWYRKSVARKAGLDIQNRPVTWQEIIRAARKTHTTVGVQSKRYEGYTVLINALIESSGGHIIENPGAPADQIKLGIDSPAGRRAAATIQSITTNGVGVPSMSNADEEAARAAFQAGDGGFMVNWPYVWQAAQAAVKDGSLTKQVAADIGWARYPQTIKGRPSAPPLGGIDLGVGRWSKHRGFAFDAARCITTEANETYYFLNEGNPAARAAAFDAPAVLKVTPMAPLVLQSLEHSAPRPRTEVYGDLTDAIQRTWHPPEEVTQATPAESSKFVNAVFDGRKLV
jgi:trehalose/maltose transport system substrate-binding protein